MFSWKRIDRLNVLSKDNLKLFYEATTRTKIQSLEILEKVEQLHPCLKAKVADYVDRLLESPENQQIIDGIPPPNDITKEELLVYKDNSPGLRPITVNVAGKTC